MLRNVFSLRTLLYLAYGLTLTAVLLYVRFPTEQFRRYCETRIELAVPGATCSIDSVSYVFPAAVRFSGINLNRKADDKSSILAVDHLTFAPVT